MGTCRRRQYASPGKSARLSNVFGPSNIVLVQSDDHQNCIIEQRERAVRDKLAEKLADVVHLILQRVVARELKKMLQDREKSISSQ